MNKKFSLILLLFATLACALPGAAPSVNIPQQSVDVNALETIIVQTAGAAQTRTAAFLPTATPTVTLTRTPSITPSPTVTFIFLLPSFTPIPTDTPIGFVPGGASGTQEVSKFKTPQPWSCRVTSVQPPRGAVIEKKLVFYTFWRILNTGTKNWTRTTIDLIYTGGYRHEGTKIQDTTEFVPPGGTLTVSAKFIAPKTAGDYNSYFKLMVGNTQFCGMVVSFTVKE